MKNNQLKLANLIRNIARFTLLPLGLLVFAFSLISGSETYGGGLLGLLKNAPNALPWLALLLLTALAWKKEFIGGSLITALGLAMVWFFNTGPNFFMVTFVLTIGITLLGTLFLLSWYLRRNSPE